MAYQAKFGIRFDRDSQSSGNSSDGSDQVDRSQQDVQSEVDVSRNDNSVQPRQETSREEIHFLSEEERRALDFEQFTAEPNFERAVKVYDRQETELQPSEFWVFNDANFKRFGRL